MADAKQATIKQVASMKKSLTQQKKGETDFAVSIEKSSLVIKKQAALLKENILKFFSPAIPETTPEKPKLSDALKDFGEKTSAVGFDILKLALLLPLLMNDKIKALVGGFFKSFLEKLGVAKPIIDGLSFALSNIEYIIGTYFGFKIWKSVKGAFDSIMQLARVTGIVAETTAAQAATVETEKKVLRDKQGRLRDEKGRFVSEKKTLEDGIKKAGDNAKSGIKSAKNDMKAAKKLGRLDILGKFNVLKEKVLPKIISLGKNFIKAIPGIGTLIGIGLILYDLWSIGSDIYDVFLGGDKEEAKAEKKATPAATTTTRGSASGTAITPTARGPAAGARGRPSTPAAKPSTASSAVAPAPSTKNATPASPATSAGKPSTATTSASSSMPTSKSDSSSVATTSTAPAAKALTPSESAPAISSASQEVLHKEEMNNATQISVTNIDNSKNTSIAAGKNDKAPPPNVYFTLLA